MKIIQSVKPEDYKKNNFLFYFFNFLRVIASGRRDKLLEKKVFTHLQNLKIQNINLLDFGCGSLKFTKELIKKKIVKKSVCVDTYDYNLNNNKFIKYIKFNDWKNIKYKKNHFDVVILIDVLHHVGVNKSEKLIKKLSYISKYIFVKEHFEYGFFSRQLLRFADFYGNYAQDVNIPNVYFDNKSWNKLIKKANLKQLCLERNVQQHKGLFNMIITPKHHFVSVLQKKN
tara:strand:- start:158 stop:841 length:684 start_codon:yes stop_codon:yes gene_type:complete